MKSLSKVLFCVLLISSVSALADDSSSTTVSAPASVATSELKSSSILDSLYFNYFGIFNGPSVTNTSSPYAMDHNGNPTVKSAINFNSDLIAAYMVTPTIGIGPDVPFYAMPVLGKGITVGDIGLRTFDAKTIATRNFTLYTNLILQAPTSDYSQSRKESIGVKTTPYFMYRPGGRWTLGMWTEAKNYLGVNSGATFKLYGAPYVSYQLTPKLSLNLEYEYEAHHNVGELGAVGFATYQRDWCPGVVWFITKGVLVNPYVQFFTTNSSISWDHAAIGAVISATVM